MGFNAFINMTCMSRRPSSDDNQEAIIKRGAGISEIMLHGQVGTSGRIFQVSCSENKIVPKMML